MLINIFHYDRVLDDDNDDDDIDCSIIKALKCQ